MECRICKLKMKKEVSNIGIISIVFLNTEYCKDDTVKEFYRCPKCGCTYTLEGNYFYPKEMLKRIRGEK